jgi:hypothetical protein
MLEGDVERARTYVSFNSWTPGYVEALMEMLPAVEQNCEWQHRFVSWLDRLGMESFGHCFVEVFMFLLAGLDETRRSIENVDVLVNLCAFGSGPIYLWEAGFDHRNEGGSTLPGVDARKCLSVFFGPSNVSSKAAEFGDVLSYVSAVSDLASILRGEALRATPPPEDKLTLLKHISPALLKHNHIAEEWIASWSPSLASAFSELERPLLHCTGLSGMSSPRPPAYLLQRRRRLWLLLLSLADCIDAELNAEDEDDERGEGEWLEDLYEPWPKEVQAVWRAQPLPPSFDGNEVAAGLDIMTHAVRTSMLHTRPAERYHCSSLTERLVWAGWWAQVLVGNVAAVQLLQGKTAAEVKGITIALVRDTYVMLCVLGHKLVGRALRSLLRRMQTLSHGFQQAQSRLYALDGSRDLVEMILCHVGSEGVALPP